MATTKRWVALLRAVNVGDRKVGMARLKELAAYAGLTDVSTHLVSGNLLFTGSGTQAQLRTRLEKAIAAEFGFTVEVLLRSRQQLEKLLADNPFADGKPAQVLIGFLDGKAEAGLADKLGTVAVNERIKVAGTEVWLDCVDGIGRSKLAARLPALVKPRIVTARNVNTVTKLAELL